ncbi:uncharacterized protein SCODWIG_00838 [Saccharomycodes ludwigii]|uniref:USP domain-containing protein n=1 Tax=Saccharomycodes ludwigii TaxID=36035 RepID=A0A376B319_9ASCO|nr:hypothetical protein SCDLUD_002011 [Saccharomycodes ludwigii]KAH3902196.1 hypothetical protein SCDLUD_002011 [Saccharomycodes ludwigii]SSD59077.1 uncharacterized protein SCODWIG_00838 [Saccharomycodes ludwigii]
MFLTSTKSKRNDKHSIGFINNRNDCFANASIQALVPLQYLTGYLNDFFQTYERLAKLLEDGGVDEHDGSDKTGSNKNKTNATNTRPVLQSFSSTATITPQNIDDVIQTNVENDTPDMPEVPLHKEVATIIQQLQRIVTTSSYISVWPVLHALEKIFNAKISGGQNDAHELTQIVLQVLQKENQLMRNYVDNNVNALSNDVVIPDFPINGYLCDHLTCLKCGNTSRINKHEFCMFSIHVPQQAMDKLSNMLDKNQMETIEGYSCLTCKIKSILANEKAALSTETSNKNDKILGALQNIAENGFINDDLPPLLKEYVDNYNKNGLSTKQLKSEIVKKTVFIDCPDILILHLSRSMFNGMSYTRNDCNVLFDEELVVNRQLIREDENGNGGKCVGVETIKYKLKSCIRHQGSHSAGHYECYRLKPFLVKDILTGEVINKSQVINWGNNCEKQQDQNNEADSTSSRTKTETELELCADTLNNNGNSNLNEIVKENVNKIRSRANSLLSLNSTSTGTTCTETSSEFSENNDINSVGENHSNSQSLEKVNSTTSSNDNSTETSSQSSYRSSTIKKMAGFISRKASISSHSKMPTTLTADSEPNVLVTSASELSDTFNTVPLKRKLKKIRSITKYPYWRVSDTKVREVKADDVLLEGKYVYMLYYERV